MKLRSQTGIAIFLMLLSISCTKENINSTSSSMKQSLSKTTAHYIGERFGGGIVFVVDNTGQHGLIAALESQGGAIWGKNILVGANGISIGTGPDNTRKIIQTLGVSGYYAALACHNYRGGGYSDWFCHLKMNLISFTNIKKCFR